MSTALSRSQRLRPLPPPQPRPASRRVSLSIGLAGALLAIAGAWHLTREWPRQTVLAPLVRSGGWERALVSEGGARVAERAEAAARASGAPAALLDGAEVLANLSAVTGDPAIVHDLRRRALALATHALRRAPVSPDGHFLAGALLAGVNPDSPDASRHLALATALDPHHAGLRQRIGLVELQRGRTAEAIVHLRTALAGDAGLARPLYETLEAIGSTLSAAAITPATPPAQAELGAWLEHSGRPEAAEAAFQTALELADIGGKPNEALWAYRRLLGFLFRQQRFAEAEALAAARLQAGLHPGQRERAVLLFDRGNALLRDGQPKNALPFLAEAEVLRPDLQTYVDLHARALAAADRHAEAAAAWGRALALPRRTRDEQRHEIPMRMARARSLAATGDRRGALVEMRRVLMVDPTDVRARALVEELAYE